MSECAHEDFHVQANIARLADDDGRVRNFVAEINIKCAACGEVFHFIGPDTGFSFTRPTVNVGATTLHAPICPGEAPLPNKIRFEMPAKEKS